MNAFELFEKAGKPYRAIVKLSESTKVFTGKRRSSVVTEFEAYITVTKNNQMAYYINPNSYHAFYMPENVVEFIPIDTMELWLRARKAADYIKRDKIHGRELDNAFENYDGDEMCAALWRLALKNEKLMVAIKNAWSPTGVIVSFEENYKKFFNLSDKELSEHAKDTRIKGNIH